jgi:hypothetical protein
MRPWYQKKRYILSLIIVVIIVIAVAASGGKKPGTSAGGSGGNTAFQRCVAHPANYVGAVPTTDCVANANGVLGMANTTVTAKWSLATGNLGDPSICAHVVIRNHNSGSISYNDLYWQLQTPSGKVESTNEEATNDLGSGGIVGGGVVTGNVCFDNPEQHGVYVGLYQPDSFNNDRGVFLFTVH